MFVTNFEILRPVAPEKSLKKKMFTHRHTQRQTLLQKRQKLYTPYVLLMPGVRISIQESYLKVPGT